MNEYTFTDYVNHLCTEILGPHYRFYPNGQLHNVIGFIYCEHYYGKDFADHDKGWRYGRHGYPGAVARIEPDKLVILDNTQRSSRWTPKCDAELVTIAQPDFLEKFMSLKDMHTKVCKAYKLNPTKLRKLRKP